MCKWKPVKRCLPCLFLFFCLSLCHITIWELLIGFAWHLTFWSFTKIFGLLQFWLNSDNKVRYYTWRHFLNCVCRTSVMYGEFTLCTSEWTGQTSWTQFLCRILFFLVRYRFWDKWLNWILYVLSACSLSMVGVISLLLSSASF
jgi:hypothetical protein